jgi:hypothetical protein
MIASGPERNVYSPCRIVQLFGHVIFVEGYDLPNFNDCHASIRWVEVAPKASQSTISLMVANAQSMSNEGEIEDAKKGIGTETGIWFYSDDITSTYEELKNKGVYITAPEKQRSGEV